VIVAVRFALAWSSFRMSRQISCTHAPTIPLAAQRGGSVEAPSLDVGILSSSQWLLRRCDKSHVCKASCSAESGTRVL
jgi:hypothetical protein